jgi:lipopolysaccharide transport system ATP-binding protein
MGDVAKQGRTIVFVSHNMTALRRMCTRAIWLEGGRALDSGDPSEVIDHYLQKNTVATLEAVWPDDAMAPGNERVRLRSVRVIPETNGSDLITVHTPLKIEFTYWNYVPGAILNVSMIVYNIEEICVFNSGSGHAPRPAGLIRQTVTIPRDFLNAGSYYVNVMIVKDASVGILLKTNVVCFEIVEGELMGNWYGKTPGAVRPKLPWKTEIIESQNFVTPTVPSVS